MTRNELDEILHQCYSVEIFPEEAAELIWGQAFDGETEKITERDTERDTETAELNSATEESSATGSEPLPNGTTFTRSYQVFLPTPKLIQTKPIFKTHQ